jgi:hypothetical protein
MNEANRLINDIVDIISRQVIPISDRDRDNIQQEAHPLVLDLIEKVIENTRLVDQHARSLGMWADKD